MLLGPMWGHASDRLLPQDSELLSAKAKAEDTALGSRYTPIQTHRRARPWQAAAPELQWIGTPVPPPAGSLLSLSRRGASQSPEVPGQKH